MSENICKLTAHQIADLIRTKKISAKEVAQSYLQAITSTEPKVQAYITVAAESALRQAEEMDSAIERGEDIPPLAGIPFAVKDNISTEGVRTTCASKMLEDYTPVFSASSVAGLTRDGAVLLGKTNLDEFAMGSSTESSAFFVSKNPWDLARVPGGSSGGSAAAVAADECVFALGSDTGGSIRQPASYCGVVSMKPTYGRVSRYGLIAYASSLDQIGPVTKDVRDCALVMNSISGKDQMDSTSLDEPLPDFTRALINDIGGMKIGIPQEFFVEGMGPQVEKAVYDAVDVLRNLGADCRETSMPNIRYSLPVYYVISPAECSSNMAKFDGVRFGRRSDMAETVAQMYRHSREEGLGAEVKQRIMLGTYMLSAGNYDALYLKAQRVRTVIRQDFQKAFEEFDVLVTPTCPDTAFKIGENALNPMATKMTDACTIPANLAGIPAITLPCGFKDGMPIGLQIMGKYLDEQSILRVAYTFEQNTDFHKKKPSL